jgi:oligopeptide transport system substrate-binding protein
MTRIRRLRILAATAGAAIFALACQGNNTGQSEQLDPNQTLNWSMASDVKSLDPAKVSSAVDITFLAEMYSGLLKFDKNLKIVPDAATSLPDVSSDGKTYTFKLRKDVKFWNGDPVTAKDWVYSWNRTTKTGKAYASNLSVITGWTDVKKKKADTMSGLTAPDDYTLVAKLDQPAGYWLSQLAMPTAAEVLSQKAVQQGGEDTWWQKPETAVGTGPFKLTRREPGKVMEFAPVANWWGGSTGTLKTVHVDIGVDPASAVQKFETKGYDLIGMANNGPDPDNILRYKNDPSKSKLEHIYPGARTTAFGYNFVNGPFAQAPGVTPGQPTADKGSDPGLDGRKALSLAVNRDNLVDVACAKGSTCVKATGGFISKGFKGYLGENGDPNAKFDPNQAKALYQKWDPDGSKTKNVTYRYNNDAAQNIKVADNLNAQWKQNLGIDIKSEPSDFPKLQDDRQAKRVILGRESWSIDYDHPQDWFDNLFNCEQAAIDGGNDQAFCDPKMDAIVNKANQVQNLDQALPQYNQASKIVNDNYVWANLFYGTQTYFTQSYVKGSGYNALYDYPWEGISILKR